MNNEKSGAPEKHVERDRVIDLLQKFPSFYALAPGEQRELEKEKDGHGNVTDWLTATYWG